MDEMNKTPAEIKKDERVKFKGGKVYKDFNMTEVREERSAQEVKVDEIKEVKKYYIVSETWGGWVNGEVLEVINKTPVTPPAPAPAVLKVGDKVSINSSATNYYPGGSGIPAWVKNDYNHIVTQLGVTKGGKACALLGKMVPKKGGAEQSGVNTWTDIDILTII